MVNFKEHIEEKNVVTGKEDFRQLSVFIANSKENPFLLKEYLKENGFLEEGFSNLLLKINSKKRNNERMDKIEFLSKKYAIEFVKGETVNYEDLSSEDKKIVNKVSLGIVLTDMVGLAGFMSIKDISNIRHEAFTKYEVTAGNKNKEKEDSVLWYNAQSSFFKKMLNVCAKDDLDLFIFDNLGENYSDEISKVRIVSENPKIQPAFDEEYGAYYEISAKYYIENIEEVYDNLSEDLKDFLFEDKTKEEVLVEPIINGLKVLFKVPEDKNSMVSADAFAKAGFYATTKNHTLKGFEFSQVPFKFFVGSKYENSYAMSNRLGIAGNSMKKNIKTGWEEHVEWYQAQIVEIEKEKLDTELENKTQFNNKG